MLTDEILIALDCPGVRGDDTSLRPSRSVLEQTFLDEVYTGTGEITLAVVKLRRELRYCVTAFGDGEDLGFNTPHHAVTQPETSI